MKEIISSNNSDIHYIERTLEGLLDFSFEENMLLLYRNLCRYLFEINPQLAVDYVNAYREMWDEEGIQFGKFSRE